jgi:hypothetical protein
MADYLASLSDEYADQYSDLNDRECYHRAVVQHHISELAATNTDFDAGEVPLNQTWQLMRDTCPRLKDMIDGGEDYTKEFRLPLHHLIRHSWSARQAKQPNSLFDEGFVRDFESTLKDALNAVDDPTAEDQTDDGPTSSP